MPIQDIKDIEEARELARLECREAGMKELKMALIAIGWGICTFGIIKLVIFYMGW